MKTPSIYKSEAGRNAIIAFYDSILNRWPVAYETLSITTRHGTTFMIACGAQSAPPLILLHGSSSNSAMWIGDAAEYSRSYRVYAIDLPGEPGKSEPLRRELNSPAYTEWMEDILSALDIEKATLLGISLGGWMALKFATAYPERVEKLALLCPSGIGPQKKSFIWRILPLMLLGHWGTQRIIRLVNGQARMPEEANQYSLLIGSSFNPRMEQVPLFSDAELRQVTMPTLLIAGEKDVLLHSQKTVNRARELLPQLTAELLPGAGHVLLNLSGRIGSFLVG